jgi:hypothetical protein
MTDAQREAMELLQGDTGAPKTDMGPLARAQRDTSAMRPAARPDDVAPEDLRSDYSKSDPRRALAGRNASITTPEAREARDARATREDPIRNDPLAGAIVQGVVAQGAGALAGAGARALAPASPIMSRTVQAATTGAAAAPDHPGQGAMLGVATQALPIARAAENSAGEAALDRVTSPKFGEGPGKAAKAIGGAAGTAIGAKLGGPIGAVAGGAAGSQIPIAVSRGLDRLAQRLAERHMSRMAALRAAAGEGAAGAAVPPAAPSSPAGAPEPPFSGKMARGPLGPIGPNEFDEGTGDAPPASNHVTVGGATKAGPQPGMSPAERGAAQGDLSDQLQRSVEILGDLRVAAATGSVTPMMLKEALDSGIPATTVYHVVGDKVAANAALKKALTGE